MIKISGKNFFKTLNILFTETLKGKMDQLEAVRPSGSKNRQ